MRAVDKEARARLEGSVRSLCEAGDYDAASTAAIRGYGPEVLGFLIGVLGSELDAADAFADLCEVLWAKLPGFGWESSLRTWVYGIARNVARTLRRNAARRARREHPAAESLLEQVARAVRTDTLTFLRTQKKTRLLSLRDALSDEDRMLLILRVDRKLEWSDVARVLVETEDGTSPDLAFLKKEAARLRKRFQIVKEGLRERAKREGLID